MGRQKRNYHDVSLDEFKAVISYDPDTGIFSRHKAARGKVRPSSKIGNISTWGYVLISSCSTRVSAHRLAWFMHYGEWPPNEMDIDHINGIRTDNRIANLRLATRSQNLLNKKKRKLPKSGVTGVELTSSGRWWARVYFNRKRHHIGVFDTLSEAQEAILIASESIHGEFSRRIEVGS